MRGQRREEEFVAFVTAHRGDLVRAATLLCAGDVATAEDLTQATLTRLYLAWPKVRRAASPIAYARTSLAHVFADEMRRAHRRRERSYEEPTRALDAEPSSCDDDRTVRSVVLDALATLGPRQRAVVVLRHWLDLDTDQTARILGCSPGTVKSQNARALAHLRGRLGEALLEARR